MAGATDFNIGEGQALLTCAAEDLLVLKAFAGRDKAWLDIEGNVLRQAGHLDESPIFLELALLLALKGTPEATDRIRTLSRQGGGLSQG